MPIMVKSKKIIEGTWPEDDLRRAFVAGAKWWEYENCGATMWNSDRRKSEKEAEFRYPGGRLIDETDKPV